MARPAGLSWLAAGSLPLMVVPSPGAERMRRVPPTAASRSAMPCGPVPGVGSAVSKPSPSSVTANSRWPSGQDKATVARKAWAYIVTSSSTVSWTMSATSCCWAPSCRFRSIRCRSSSWALTSRRRDARGSSMVAGSSGGQADVAQYQTRLLLAIWLIGTTSPTQGAAASRPPAPVTLRISRSR
jgi:hypothetical protein